jgi:hypothetical protein
MRLIARIALTLGFAFAWCAGQCLDFAKRRLNEEFPRR